MVGTISRSVLCLSIIAGVTAYLRLPEVPNNAAAEIPGSGITCLHFGSKDCIEGGLQNDFGLDFAAAGFSWTKELCLMDSDGDGLTNGEELGDPCCLWSPENMFPHGFRTTQLSHPGEDQEMGAVLAQGCPDMGRQSSRSSGDILGASKNTPVSIPHVNDVKRQVLSGPSGEEDFPKDFDLPDGFTLPASVSMVESASIQADLPDGNSEEDSVTTKPPPVTQVDPATGTDLDDIEGIPLTPPGDDTDFPQLPEGFTLPPGFSLPEGFTLPPDVSLTGPATLMADVPEYVPVDKEPVTKKPDAKPQESPVVVAGDISVDGSTMAPYDTAPEYATLTADDPVSKVPDKTNREGPVIVPEDDEVLEGATMAPVATPPESATIIADVEEDASSAVPDVTIPEDPTMVPGDDAMFEGLTMAPFDTASESATLMADVDEDAVFASPEVTAPEIPVVESGEDAGSEGSTMEPFDTAPPSATLTTDIDEDTVSATPDVTSPEAPHSVPTSDTGSEGSTMPPFNTDPASATLTADTAEGAVSAAGCAAQCALRLCASGALPGGSTGYMPRGADAAFTGRICTGDAGVGVGVGVVSSTGEALVDGVAVSTLGLAPSFFKAYALAGGGSGVGHEALRGLDAEGGLDGACVVLPVLRYELVRAGAVVGHAGGACVAFVVRVE